MPDPETTQQMPKEITGPVAYVWVEVHEISLHEESTQVTRNWPATSELRTEVEAAKATHGRVSAILMRKDEWEEKQRG